MEKYYTINDVAQMTGFTTRTLRYYLKDNTLSGEKIDGVWQFTEEEISDFISNPNVNPGIQAKNKAVVYDFLIDNNKKENQICTIMDIHTTDKEPEKIATFFCDYINNSDVKDITFKFEKHKKNVRVIISGHEESVINILNAYYQQ